MSKATATYKHAFAVETGRGAVLQVLDKLIKTTQVVFADTATGIIETRNTVYRPLPNTPQPHFNLS